MDFKYKILMPNQSIAQSIACLANDHNFRRRQEIHIGPRVVKSEGFTLLELIVAIALFAFLVTVAVPGFQGTLRNNRLTTQANALLGALSLARSESIKRNLRVTLCKSGDGANCTEANDYRQGWIVFIDSYNPALRDAGEEIIQIFNAVTGAMTITGNSSVRHYVSYTGAGMTQLANGGFQAGTITLCQDATARRIVISATGRARVTRGTC